MSYYKPFISFQSCPDVAGHLDWFQWNCTVLVFCTKMITYYHDFSKESLRYWYNRLSQYCCVGPSYGVTIDQNTCIGNHQSQGQINKPIHCWCHKKMSAMQKSLPLYPKPSVQILKSKQLPIRFHLFMELSTFTIKFTASPMKCLDDTRL